jgi:hypothetical protein
VFGILASMSLSLVLFFVFKYPGVNYAVYVTYQKKKKNYAVYVVIVLL